MNRIYIKELTCYKNADEDTRKHRLVYPERFFDLDKLPTNGLIRQFEKFIVDRGCKLKLLSVRSELSQFNEVCKFINYYYKELEDILSENPSVLEKNYKKWLIKNGKKVISRHYRTETNGERIKTAAGILYLRKIYKFLEPKKTEFSIEDDIWNLELIASICRQNPVKRARSVSFQKIKQQALKNEIKKAIYEQLFIVSIGTVQLEISAIIRFSKFLSEKYPEVCSINDIDREIIEDYLGYLNTEVKTKKSFRSELYHLKTIINNTLNLLEHRKCSILILQTDFGKEPEILFETYSEEELMRMNTIICTMDKQIARILALIILLGARISDVLTLKMDCLENEEENSMIRFEQVKTRMVSWKYVDKTARDILEKAMKYTREKYGETEYIFVSEENPNKPMNYSKVKYHFQKAVNNSDLRMDNGEPFSAKFHVFRRNYGKRLAELGFDDITIANMLGHTGLDAVKHYRKISNQTLAKETRELRIQKSRLIEKTLKGTKL